MNTYKAGFVGTGTVIHLSHEAGSTLCFDSRRGNNRKIYFAQAVSESASEALAIASDKTGAKICQVCAKAGA